MAVNITLYWKYGVKRKKRKEKNRKENNRK
jgi:hypothetical protein